VRPRRGVARRLLPPFRPTRSRRADADLRDLIQREALTHRHYGYRRVAQALRRQGLIVNAKRVLRLMRADNLLSLRARPFVPRTSDSRHGFAIRPNLARSLRPTGLDQLWVADITYVRLAEDFVYLAVVIDAFSRKVVGWALAGHLEASLALEALDQALAARQPQPESLITTPTAACSTRAPTMSTAGSAQNRHQHEPAGNPYDNAKAESFMKTLKTEEVNGKAYANIEDARRQIGAFIETIYNRQRLHSALGYKPPVEFEAELRPVTPTPNQDEACHSISVSHRRGAVQRPVPQKARVRLWRSIRDRYLPIGAAILFQARADRQSELRPPSFRPEIAKPIGRRDPAIHEEIAACDEGAVRSHQKRGDSPHLIRRTGRPAGETSIMRRYPGRAALSVRLLRAGS